MPTMAHLAKLATELYKGNPTVGAYEATGLNLQLDTSKVASLGFTGASFYVWSGEESNSLDAHCRYFGQSNTYWGYNGRYGSGGQAVCLSE